MKVSLLPLALALFSGCVAGIPMDPAPLPYLYDTELPPVMVGGEPNLKMRLVPQDKPPIPPVEFGQWFIPSSWAIKLAAQWAELPYAFDEAGPEYCAALGVDKHRMLHVSIAVRYRNKDEADVSCPALIWTGEGFMISLSTGSHSHHTPKDHGESISVSDATLGGPLLVGVDSQARVETLRIAVSFYSGERLMGIDPDTGKEAPVPAQSLLFTRYNGTVHVFLWTPFAAGAEGKSNFVRVYKPASSDGWEKLGICWVDEKDVHEAVAIGYHPTVRCTPDDFWLK